MEKTCRNLTLADVVAASAGHGTAVWPDLDAPNKKKESRIILGTICGSPLSSNNPVDVAINERLNQAEELCRKNPEIVSHLRGGQR